MQIQTQKYNYNYKAIPPNSSIIRHSADEVLFKGLRTKDAKALFAFDLDGTLAHGSNEDIQKVFELAKKANATVVYVTGRSIEKFYALQRELARKGVTLPSPKYLCTDNGQSIYTNRGGDFHPSRAWTRKITQDTNFNRSEVYDSMHKLSHTDDYYLDEDDLVKMIKRPDFNKRKEADKNFYSSKISYYEFHPSQFGLEYILSPKIKIDKLENDVTATLGKNGIKAKFTYFKFDKEKVDKSGDDIIAKSRPFRENSKGEVKALFLSPLDKSDSIEYLRNKLGIAHNEVFAAGDEGNDYPVAKLTKNGSFFVCVANATKDFKRLVLNMKDKKRNTLILAKNEGAAGIIEGIEKVLAKFRPDLN